MQPYRPRPARLPAHVYRRRRAAVASAGVLVIAALVSLTGFGRGDDGQEASVTMSDATSTTTTTFAPPPACAEGDEPVHQDPLEEWDSIIVDPGRALPSDFAPPDLVNVAEAGFPLGTAVRGFVIDDLRELREAAEENGTPISVIVGFRSYGDQAYLHDRRSEEIGASATRERVARPGHSEHQLGTTIDVTDEGADDVDQQWGSTPTGQWIMSNAHRYGFVVSYPPDSMDRTCFDYEPWHLRYVGRERAAEVLDSGRTLREVLYAIERHGTPPTTLAPGSTTIDADAG